jgi:curved DNA-binding protein CbpA
VTSSLHGRAALKPNIETMVLKQEVIDAFEYLGLIPDSPRPAAEKAYKKLALQHHPDRNRDDPTATARFQDVRIFN